MTGFYAWLPPTRESSLDLSTFLLDFEEVCPTIDYYKPTKYHVTLAYDDSANVFDVAIPSLANDVQATMMGFECFNSHVVILLRSSALDHLFRYFRAQGLKWNYDTYSPHLTIGKGTKQDVEELNINFNYIKGLPLNLLGEVYYSPLR